MIDDYETIDNKSHNDEALLWQSYMNDYNAHSRNLSFKKWKQER